MAEIPRPVPVSCPQCGSTGTYKPNTSNGTTIVTCRNCHKNFGIEIRNGQVFRTK
jgi:transcription elongation factor Elf1